MAGRRSNSAGSDEWFRRARRYLRIASDNLDLGHADAGAFYAQQAAEFALKALQLDQSNRIMRVHDLLMLAKDVKAPPRIEKLAMLVSPAYVGARYPDVGGTIRRKKAETILDASRRIVRWVRRQMV